MGVSLAAKGHGCHEQLDLTIIWVMPGKPFGFAEHLAELLVHGRNFCMNLFMGFHSKRTGQKSNQWVFMFSCPSTAQDYQLLKKEILVWCDLSIHQVAAAFHGWNYDPSFTPRSCQNSLLPTTRQLLQVLSFSSVTGYSGNGAGGHDQFL